MLAVVLCHVSADTVNAGKCHRAPQPKCSHSGLRSVRLWLDSGATMSIINEPALLRGDKFTIHKRLEPVDLAAFDGNNLARVDTEVPLRLTLSNPSQIISQECHAMEDDHDWTRLPLPHPDLSLARWDHTLLYCSELAYSLLSVGQLNRMGFSVTFSPDRVVMSWSTATRVNDNDGTTAIPAIVTTVAALDVDQHNGMPYIDVDIEPRRPLQHCDDQVSAFATRDIQHVLAARAITAKPATPMLRSLGDWRNLHVRFGHLCGPILQSMALRLGLCPLHAQAPTRLKECNACGMGAGRTADMSKKSRTVADVFGRRTFFDLSGPYRPAGPNGERFVLLFIDCFTHWRTIVLMQRKSEAVEAIINYHRTVIIPALRDQKDTTVLFRTDKDAVWGDREVKEVKPYCDAQGIKAEFAATASPWHIGLCERQWSTVGNIVRKLLIHGKLPRRIGSTRTPRAFA